VLNKHQWNEVESCSQRRTNDENGDCCKACSIQYVCLAEELAMYRKMLMDIQFVKDGGRIGGAIYKFCPICGNATIHGHENDCELASLLRTGEESAELRIKSRLCDNAKSQALANLIYMQGVIE